MKRFAILIAAALVAFSCDKQPAYAPGEPDPATCYRVYFPDQLGFGSQLLRPSAPHAFTFKVARERTAGAITVPVTIDATSQAVAKKNITAITMNTSWSVTDLSIYLNGGTPSGSPAVYPTQAFALYKVVGETV